MNKLTYLISIKSFFEKGNDIIGAFSYIVLQCLSTSLKNVESIQQSINETFKIEMPISFVRTCLKRLTKEGYCNDVNSPRLSEKGSKVLTKIQEETENADREIKTLIHNIKEHLSEDILKTVSDEEILTAIVKIIEENTKDVAEGFRHSKNGLTDDNDATGDKLTKEIIRFFILAEARDKNSFDILKSIGQGVVINAILKRDSFDKIEESFSDLVIFLDTNFIFAILGLSTPEPTKAANEILEIIKQYKNISVRIFPFTLEEIKSYIQAYLNNPKKTSVYVHGWSVGGARYKLAGMQTTDIVLLRDRMESELGKRGILVRHDIKGDLFSEEEPGTLSEFKQSSDLASTKTYPQKSLEHDLNAFKHIEKLRNRKVYSLEDSKFLFLTLDNKLAKFNSRMHDTSKPEVITMESLTAVLWTKKPNFKSSLPIHNIMAGCREKIMIHEDIWYMLIQTLKDMKGEELTEEDMNVFATNAVLDEVEGRREMPSQEVVRKFIIAGQEELKLNKDEKANYEALKDEAVQLKSTIKSISDDNASIKTNDENTISSLRHKNERLTNAMAFIILSVIVMGLTWLFHGCYRTGILGTVESVNLLVVEFKNLPVAVLDIVVFAILAFCAWKCFKPLKSLLSKI